MTAAARPRRHAGHADWTSQAVWEECLAWALDNMPDTEGLAGGLTGPQRRALRGGPR